MRDFHDNRAKDIVDDLTGIDWQSGFYHLEDSPEFEKIQELLLKMAGSDDKLIYALKLSEIIRNVLFKAADDSILEQDIMERMTYVPPRLM